MPFQRNRIYLRRNEKGFLLETEFPRSLRSQTSVWERGGENISKKIQIKIWKRLSGEWQDDRDTNEIINDIYNSRTLGCEFPFKFLLDPLNRSKNLKSNKQNNI